MTDFENDNMDLEDLENDIIELIDEDGESVPFEYLTTIEYEGKKYIALIPADEVEDEEEGEVVILEIQEGENGEDVYVMEVFHPGVYRTGTTEEQSAILRKSV